MKSAIVFLSLALLLESMFTTLPIFLDALLLFYVIRRESWLAIAAFIGGIMLDVLFLRTIGLSSMFFLFFLFLSKLYERKFEINTYQFIFLFSFTGSFFYLVFFGSSFILEQAFLSCFLTLLLFAILTKFFVSYSI